MHLLGKFSIPDKYTKNIQFARHYYHWLHDDYLLLALSEAILFLFDPDADDNGCDYDDDRGSETPAMHPSLMSGYSPDK
jgi:hypothetical protein